MHKPYPDRGLWTDVSESLEFRRLLDLVRQRSTKVNNDAVVKHTFFCSFWDVWVGLLQSGALTPRLRLLGCGQDQEIHSCKALGRLTCPL